MTIYINSLLIAVILMIYHVVFVICLLRKMIKNQLSPVVIHVFSGICTLLILMIVWIAKIFVFDVWITFTILAFSISSFLFLFCAVYKSLSLRFLLMTKQRKGYISFSDLDFLVTGVSFCERTKILCQMGLVIKDGNGFRISQKGMLIAKRIARIQTLFGIKTKGLYQENK